MLCEGVHINPHVTEFVSASAKTLPQGHKCPYEVLLTQCIEAIQIGQLDPCFSGAQDLRMLLPHLIDNEAAAG